MNAPSNLTPENIAYCASWLSRLGENLRRSGNEVMIGNCERTADLLESQARRIAGLERENQHLSDVCAHQSKQLFSDSLKTDWQSIATAPKDGTPIVAKLSDGLSDGREPYAVVTYGRKNSKCWEYADSGYALMQTPLEWLPLHQDKLSPPPSTELTPETLLVVVQNASFACGAFPDDDDQSPAAYTVLMDRADVAVKAVLELFDSQARRIVELGRENAELIDESIDTKMALNVAHEEIERLRSLPPTPRRFYNSLPEWDFCRAHEKAGTANALELFIAEQEPAGNEEEAEFRDGLLAALNQVHADLLAADCPPPVEPEAATEAKGTFACPICGNSDQHGHPDYAIKHWIESQVLRFQTHFSASPCISVVDDPLAEIIEKALIETRRHIPQDLAGQYLNTEWLDLVDHALCALRRKKQPAPETEDYKGVSGLARAWHKLLAASKSVSDEDWQRLTELRTAHETGASRGWHPTHKMRFSDSSLYDDICDQCGYTDMNERTCGMLELPCMKQPPETSESQS